MEENRNHSILGNEPSNTTVTMETDLGDVRTLAADYLMYKIGAAINRIYFPVLVPVGIMGNLLSFLVMIQRHNRHMSISLYISSLAVTDTIALLIAMMTYLNSVHGLQFPPDQHWFCCIATTVLWASTLSSTLFILSMTFDRVYSIIRPHKAASFNTVKRAKTTIVSIIIFSCLFNIPYLFVVTNDGFECVALLNKFGEKLFFWVSYLVQFIVPFVSLLSMNSILVHTLRKRYLQQIASVEAQCYNQVFSQLNSEGQGQGHGQIFKYKHTDRQVCVIPLLVAFSFFVLISPFYAFLLYIETVDFTKSPAAFAEFFLFYQVMHKMYYTNNAINLFLYVISGRKFRRDLVNLFRWNVKWKVVHSK